MGKFVEFFGPGVAHLSLADRATISNMCPEYGATVGYFPPDAATISYLTQTGQLFISYAANLKLSCLLCYYPLLYTAPAIFKLFMQCWFRIVFMKCYETVSLKLFVCLSVIIDRFS